MYILTGTLDSLMNANYGALFPTLFKTDELRAKTNAIRQVCQLVAMVISIVLTPVVTSKIGYNLTAIIYGVIALAVIMFMTFGCHENIEEEEAEAANDEARSLQGDIRPHHQQQILDIRLCKRALFRRVLAHFSGNPVLCSVYSEA